MLGRPKGGDRKLGVSCASDRHSLLLTPHPLSGGKEVILRHVALYNIPDITERNSIIKSE